MAIQLQHKNICTIRKGRSGSRLKYTIGLQEGVNSETQFPVLRRGGRRFGAYSVLGAALLFAMSLSRLAAGKDTRAPVTMDANALVRRMISTYKGAQTFQETSEARLKRIPYKEYIQATTVRFKRPNLLYLSSEDPAIGTYQGYCNGKTLSVYFGSTNVYTKRKSPNTLRQTLSTLAKTGEAMVKTPIVQTLSPISFVNAYDMPDECKQFRFVRMDMVNGKKAAMVSGNADADWLATLGASKQTVFDRKDVTLWIDTSRYVLLKAAFNMRWHVDFPNAKNRNGGTIVGGLSFVETHEGIVLNPPLRDEEFFFNPPKGAVEKFQEQR